MSKLNLKHYKLLELKKKKVVGVLCRVDMQNKGHILYLGRLEKLDDQGACANDELKFIRQQGLDLFVEKRWKDAAGKGYC